METWTTQLCFVSFPKCGFLLFTRPFPLLDLLPLPAHTNSLTPTDIHQLTHTLIYSHQLTHTNLLRPARSQQLTHTSLLTPTYSAHIKHVPMEANLEMPYEKAREPALELLRI